MAGSNFGCVRAIASFAVVRFFKRLSTHIACLSFLLPGLVSAQAQMSMPGSFAVNSSGELSPIEWTGKLFNYAAICNSFL